MVSTGSTSGDPRLAPVEQNLFDCMVLFETSRISPLVEDDVWTWTSDIDFPLFSGAINARFTPETTERRAHETLDRLVGNGRPFMWWLTPSTRSPSLEAVLEQRGLVLDEPATGMYADLDGAPDSPLPAGVSVEVTTGATLDTMLAAMLDGFGMPKTLLSAVRELFGRSRDPVELVHVLARVDGEPAGAGSVIAAGDVAGLYNIAVREQARGRGVGGAVTQALMRQGSALGCTRSILHATPMGRPVYARLGYQPVCEITQYVWMPSEDKGEMRGTVT